MTEKFICASLTVFFIFIGFSFVYIIPLTIVNLHVKAECLRLGWKEARITWNFQKYCCREENEFDITKPLEEILRGVEVSQLRQEFEKALEKFQPPIGTLRDGAKWGFLYGMKKAAEIASSGPICDNLEVDSHSICKEIIEEEILSAMKEFEDGKKASY